MKIVYFNGRFIDKKEAFLPACSRGALFGDGVFTTLLVKDGLPLFLESHMHRIKSNLKDIHIIPPKIEKSDVFELIKRNKAVIGRYRLRITVFSNDDFSLDLKKRGNALVLMTLSLTNSILFKSPLKLMSYPKTVISPLCKIKTVSYLNRFFLKNYALENNFDDVIVHGEKGEILEASFFNIFWVYKNSFFYPDDKLPYFFGLTIQNIIKKVEQRGYIIKKGVYFIEAIPEKASVFLCSSINPLIPVAQINDHFFKFREDLSFLKY